MYITTHAQIRYIQRVLGIKDEEDAKEYLKENHDKIKFDLYEYLNNESFIRDSCIYDLEHGGRKAYYIADDIIFVMESSFGRLITVYKVSQPEDLEEYLRLIRINNDKITRLKSEKIRTEKESRGLEVAVQYLEKQLDECKKELNDSIQNSRMTTHDINSLKSQNYKLLTLLKGTGSSYAIRESVSEILNIL